MTPSAPAVPAPPPPGREELPDGSGPAERHGRLAPEPEVLLAIARAAQAAWPRPVPAARRSATPPWRFSGRWWSLPPALRRDRPVR